MTVKECFSTLSLFPNIYPAIYILDTVLVMSEVPRGWRWLFSVVERQLQRAYSGGWSPDGNWGKCRETEVTKDGNVVGKHAEKPGRQRCKLELALCDAANGSASWRHGCDSRSVGLDDHIHEIAHYHIDLHSHKNDKDGWHMG